MRITHEKVNSDFLIDDLQGLIGRHDELLQSYRDALEKVRAPTLQRMFNSVMRDHEHASAALMDVLSNHHRPVSHSTVTAAAPVRLRVIFGRLLSDAAVVRALLTNEQALLHEYSATINNMVYLPEFEQVLQDNRLGVQQRVARLGLLIGLDD
jgi:hypothetical protein